MVSSNRSPEEHEHEADNRLRQQVTERLAAHRARRDRGATPAPAPPQRSPVPNRVNRIAATVAERYAHSPSYRDFLAAEAQRAIDAANAAAEIAARNALAISVVQQQLLEELEQARVQELPQLTLLPSPSPEFNETYETHETYEQQEQQQPTLELLPAPAPPLELALVPPPTRPRRQLAEAPLPAPARTAAVARPDAPLTVRLFSELEPLPRASASGTRSSVASALRNSFDEEDERMALDEEIAFRQTPVFEEPASLPEPLPANLIEFPRQLIAARRVRARFAEGPLREEADAAPSTAQLRIFEVEAAKTAPSSGTESAAPEWSSICLETPRTHSIEVDETPFVLPPQAAPLNLRLMATAVDAGIVAASFLSFAAVAALTASRLPTGPTAALSALGALVLLFLLYHTLFFTLSDATPGMRCARIALCTFSDENPTRSAMRRRTWALLLSASPLGMGFLWAYLDDDRLGWHDRISRMYQRSY
jgi:hypothetical protein